MNIDDLLRRAVSALGNAKVPFAVAGGFAADTYRSEHRVTADVDLAILVEGNAAGVATAIVESLGLQPAVARKADLEGGPLFAIRRKSTEPCMIVGRREGRQDDCGVDILLPAIPWVSEAVGRAQSNLKDFGFGPIPVLTVEDVILAKLSALKHFAHRFKDLDDLASIFSRQPDMNIKYLAGQMKRLDLTVPRDLADAVPSAIRKISRDVAADRRTRSRKG